MEVNFARIRRIGGIGFIVEIDETLLHKRKYNRGRFREPQWLVGGICLQTKEFFVVLIDDRKTATMKAVLSKYLLLGTIILTDEQRAYDKACSDLEFTHRTINHSLNYVDPVHSWIHTQAIEALWSSYKRWLRKNSYDHVHREFVEEYLAEWMYMKRNPSWEEFIEDIKDF